MKASWYGDPQPMANGQPFRPNDPTIAAHKELPLGTVLRVTGPSGKQLVMKVEDRGPYVAGRQLDVSEAAAHVLGFHQAGVATLDVEVVSRPEPKTALRSSRVTMVRKRSQ